MYFANCCGIKGIKLYYMNSHHSVANYFPITTNPVVFYSHFIFLILAYTYSNIFPQADLQYISCIS